MNKVKEVKSGNALIGYIVDGISFHPLENCDIVKEWLAEGNEPEPEFTEEELQKQAEDKLARETKASKQLALVSITVEVNGKVFDGDDKARLNMLSALQAASVTGIETTYWKLADNSVAEITVEELREALTKAIQRVGEIVTNG